MSTIEERNNVECRMKNVELTVTATDNNSTSYNPNSKLGKLIQQYCPDGVEYKTLGEVCEFRAGWGFPEVEQGLAEGKYPFYKVGDMNNSEMFMDTANNYISEETSKKLKCKPAPKGTIIFPKIGATMNTNKKRILTKQSCYDNNVMGLIAKSVNDRFLYYFFSQYKLIDFAKGTGAVPSLDTNRLKALPIPLPPLPVQEAIVNILDRFAVYAAELQAELQARQQQYNYYRDTLLSFEGREDVQWKKLGEVCIYAKERIGADLVDENNYVSVENLLPNQRGKEKASNVPKEGNCIKFEPNDILVGNIRPYLHKIWYADCVGGTNGDVLCIRIKDDAKKIITPRYLYCILSSHSFFEYDNSYSKGAKMPRGDKQKVMEYEFGIPSLSEQQRIVDILDRFDTLVNDLSQGLPAEIEARQQQYEYYRDQLLTFKRKEA